VAGGAWEREEEGEVGALGWWHRGGEGGRLIVRLLEALSYGGRRVQEPLSALSSVLIMPEEMVQ
jgi:hypothetical protein